MLALVCAAGCRSGQTPQRPATGAPSAPAAPPPSDPAPDRTAAIRAINQTFLAEQRRKIAGHESEPAGQVFKNVQFLDDTRASTFLVIMSVGYADALGVTCTHCHSETDFSSDEKRPKRAAREMQLLHRNVNTQLRQMENLASQPADQRAINCTTCHRGRINPATPNP